MENRRNFLKLVGKEKLRSWHHAQIKVALAHPAASNGICSHHRSGFSGLLKINYFHLVICFFFFLISLNFQHSF